MPLVMAGQGPGVRTSDNPHRKIIGLTILIIGAALGLLTENSVSHYWSLGLLAVLIPMLIYELVKGERQNSS
jgi:hypothetical protein